MKGQLKAPRMRVVLYEGKGSRPLDHERRLDTLVTLLEDGHSITRSATDGAVAPADDALHLVLGEFEDEPPKSAATVSVVDISNQSAVDVKAPVRQAAEHAGATTNAPGD